MRFRQHQAAAQASTRRLLLWFVLAVFALVLAVNGVLALTYRLTVPFATAYPALFFETNTGLVLLFVLGGCWFESWRLRDGGVHVARIAGGRPAQVSGYSAADRLERRYSNIVQEIALASRAPLPAAWLLPRDDAINAFAAGWTADDAVIVVTRGALERLTREELQGVVAHEFSHLVHGDTRLNMRLIGLVWGLQMVFTFGRMLAEPNEHGRRGIGTLIGFGLMAVGALGWAAGRALQAAVSRQREFLADASAVKYTRGVAGLGGALRKIADQARRRADRLRSPHASSLLHLCLHGGDPWLPWASHPPLAERLRRLYGRDVEPVPADVQPPAGDEPLLAFVPRTVEPARASAGPEALRHDPTQPPARQIEIRREHDALDRIGRWHGPGERTAALLLLLADPDDARAQAAARQAVSHLRVAAAVQDEIDVLGPDARRSVFEQLARRSGTAPRAERLALLNSCGALAATPRMRLRWWLLRELLRGRRSSLRVPRAANLGRELAAVSAFIAEAIGSPRWYAAVAPGLPMPHADLRHIARCASRLQGRLPPMQRPVVLRAWLRAAADAGVDPARALDVFATVALLLELPLPAPAQWRNL